MIFEALKRFLEERCPLMQDKGLKVNYLGELPKSFTIDMVPGTPLVLRYPDGGCLLKQLFVLATREFYDGDVRQNLDVCGFYEAFSQWIEEINRKQAFPDLGEGIAVRSISVLSGGYLYQAGERTARYQIQCQLLYEKDGVF